MDRYDEIFIKDLNLKAEDLLSNPSSESVEVWDSLAQITMVSNIEEAYGIMLDPEDILRFNSYEAGKEILKKYISK